MAAMRPQRHGPDFESSIEVALSHKRPDIAANIVSDAIAQLRGRSESYYERTIKLAVQIGDIGLANSLSEEQINAAMKMEGNPSKRAAAFRLAISNIELIPDPTKKQGERAVPVAKRAFQTLNDLAQALERTGDIRALYTDAFEFAKQAGAGALNSAVRDAIDTLNAHAIRTSSTREIEKAYTLALRYARSIDSPFIVVDLIRIRVYDFIKQQNEEEEVSGKTRDHRFYFTAVHLANIIEDRDLKEKVVHTGVALLGKGDEELKGMAAELAYELNVEYALKVCEDLRLYDKAAQIARRESAKKGMPSMEAEAEMYDRLHELLRPSE